MHTIIPRPWHLKLKRRFSAREFPQSSIFRCRLNLPYYSNIMRYINQREFGLHNVKLYRANKCSVNFLSANLHSDKKWN